MHHLLENVMPHIYVAMLGALIVCIEAGLYILRQPVVSSDENAFQRLPPSF